MPRISRVHKTPVTVAKAVKSVRTTKTTGIVPKPAKATKPTKATKIVDASQVPAAVAGVLGGLIRNVPAAHARAMARARERAATHGNEPKHARPEPMRFADGKTFAETMAANKKTAKASKISHAVTDDGRLLFASRKDAEKYCARNDAEAKLAFGALRAVEHIRERHIAEAVEGSAIEVNIELRFGDLRVTVGQADNFTPNTRLNAISLLSGSGKDEKEWGDVMSVFYAEFQVERTLSDMVEFLMDMHNDRSVGFGGTNSEPAVVVFRCRDNTSAARYGLDTVEFMFLCSQIECVTNTVYDITIPQRMHTYPNRSTHPAIGALFPTHGKDLVNGVLVTHHEQAWLHVEKPELVFDAAGRYAPNTRTGVGLYEAIPLVQNGMALSGFDLDDILERVVATAATEFKARHKRGKADW